MHDGGVLEVWTADVPDEGHVSLSRMGEVVVIDGPQELVDRLVEADPALRAAAPVKPASEGAVGALAALSGAVGSADSAQQVFQLDAVGLEMFRNGQLVDAGGGFKRLVGQGSGGRFSAQGALKPVELGPAQLATVQMAMATMALTAAIKDVQAAVERVESKVDLLRDYLESDRVGQIGGLNRLLRRHAGQLGVTGRLSDTDWESIDDVAVQIDQHLATLRSFIAKRLRAAEEEGQRLDGRVEALEHLEALGESLTLLLVAEDNQLLFEQLRLHRIRDTEPDHFGAALEASMRLVEAQKDEDRRLVHAVRAATGDRVGVRALEIHRLTSTPALARSGVRIDTALAGFAAERRLPYAPVEIPKRPSVAEAYGELRERGTSLAGTSRHVAGEVAGGGKQVLSDLSARVRRRDGEADPITEELGSGNVAKALLASTEDEDPTDADDTSSHGSGRFGRLRDRASDATGRARTKGRSLRPSVRNDQSEEDQP